MRLEVLPATTGESIQSVRELFQEYWSAFEFSPCFQNFSTEVEQLPGAYSPPGGRLGLAWVNCELAGCIALRPKDATRGEAKRLYVRPRFRGCGVGRALMDWMIEEARSIGYHEIVGDTLPVMASALKMYQGMGFEQLPPDPETPQGAIYIRLDLAAYQPARR
jgi:GNAT superfamily N-acetyltransferase